MGVLDSLIHLCMKQLPQVFPVIASTNQTAALCDIIVDYAINNHEKTGVLDFETLSMIYFFYITCDGLRVVCIHMFLVLLTFLVFFGVLFLQDKFNFFEI